jgi:hypothetical protein
MNSKLLSEKALAVIDQYLHFKIGSVVISIPYYNNSRTPVRGGLRAAVGKGSPKDIYEEIEIALAKNHAAVAPGAIASGAYVPGTMTADSLKHFLVEKNIGVDCSGFVYYVLNAESMSRGKGSFDRHLSFPLCKGIFGKIRAKTRPVENANVATFAHPKNTTQIHLNEVKPGDIITMLGDRNHVLVVNQVEYQNFIPTTIHYSHSIAWPTDGEFDHGVRQGTIVVYDSSKPLTEQEWTENGKTGDENYTLMRAKESKTELRAFPFLEETRYH